MTETWGALQLAESSARLASFEGDLALEPAGVMPVSAGSELAGAKVYRVKNADDFFERNKGRNAVCTQPLRWLAIASRSNETSPDGAIWLAMLTLEDWSGYSPEKQGYCGGGLYVPKAAQAHPNLASPGLQVSCDGESFHVQFESTMANIESSDGATFTLPRVNPAAGQEEPRRYSDGRLTFTNEADGTGGPRVSFARGRMMPQRCGIAQNAPTAQ